MNISQSEIIEMARQVGKNLETSEEGYRLWTYEALEAFAKLVAEREREKFCAVLRQLHDSYSLASDSNAIRARGQA